MALALLPFGCVLLYLRDPAGGGIFPSCPFRVITGYECPGCGTGRALHQLMHGHIRAAFGLNVFAMLVLPILVYAGLSSLSLTFRGIPLPSVHVPPRLLWGIPVLVVSFWVARNLPFASVAWMSSFR